MVFRILAILTAAVCLVLAALLDFFFIRAKKPSAALSLASFCVPLLAVLGLPLLFGYAFANFFSASLCLASLSLAVLCAGVHKTVILIIYNYFHAEKKRITLAYIVGIALCCVLLFQISVNMAWPYDFDAPDGVLPFGALFTRVVSGTLQYFSFDADYFTLSMLAADPAFTAWGAEIYETMGCVLPIYAPLSTGFAVISILCSFLPSLQLFFLSHRRTKYVFSELNLQTIETAESIAKKKADLRRNRAGRLKMGKEDWKYLDSSVIIFCDVYPDRSAEIGSELLERAKRIGAICLKSDVLTLPLRWTLRTKKRAVYLLMDLDEKNNINNALGLLGDNRQLWRRSLDGAVHHTRTDQATFYVISQDPDAGGYLKEFADTLRHGSDGTTYPVVVKLLNEYRNLVYRLIDANRSADEDGERWNYPLYYADERDLETHSPVGRQTPYTLSVLIVGGGRIAKEFFKAVFWCGQMLRSDGQGGYRPLDLLISVISDDADVLEETLRFDMPGVFEVSEPFGKPENPNARQAPLCRYRFCKAKFGTESPQSSFRACFWEKTAPWTPDKIDYVLVALGDDDRNFRAASWIAREIDKANITYPREVPISFVIESQSLCESLHAIGKKSSGEKRALLNPFGSLHQRFHYDNIVMGSLVGRAYSVDSAHGGACDKGEFETDPYRLQSSMASALHYRYKVHPMPEDRMAQIIKAGREAAIRHLPAPEGDVLRPLFWLEHRRWCAYMLTIGFRCFTAKQFIDGMLDIPPTGPVRARRAKPQQDRLLKLHACLVEGNGDIDPARTAFDRWAANEREKQEALLFDAIRAHKDVPEDMTLEAWLKEILPLWRGSDSLDRLGILCTVIEGTSEPKNFKQYDIDVVTYLRADIMRGGIHEKLLLGEFERGDILGEVQKLIREVGALLPEKEAERSNQRVAADGMQAVRIFDKKNEYTLVAVQTRGNFAEGYAGFKTRTANWRGRVRIQLDACEFASLGGADGMQYALFVFPHGKECTVGIEGRTLSVQSGTMTLR